MNKILRAKPTIDGVDYVEGQSVGGLVLMAALLMALMWGNSPLFASHTRLFELDILGHSFAWWINDGLMVVFFFLVGMEIKRELVVGELAKPAARWLPFGAAVGGMAMPALLFLAINHNHEQALPGWAIACATDIAFALGVLSLLGRKIVPPSVRMFLLALAIFDDLGAVLIIGLFYSGGIEPVWLLGVAALAGVLWLMNRKNVPWALAYVAVGVVLWYVIHASGLHATLAGVITAMALPLTKPNEQTESVLMRLEHGVQPWVVWLILPLFALANAAVPFGGQISGEAEHVAWGVGAGLVLGKAVGIVLGTGVVLALMKEPLPAGMTWLRLLGVALLGGIGFTMSLFVAELAYRDNSDLLAGAKLGILAGSLISAIMGVMILWIAEKRPWRHKKSELLDCGGGDGTGG